MFTDYQRVTFFDAGKSSTFSAYLLDSCYFFVYLCTENLFLGVEGDEE